MLTITKKKDVRVVRAFTHKLADIPNGVTVSENDFVNNRVLSEGTAIGKNPATGLYHIIKMAILTAAASNTDTTYTVAKGHDLKVGDYIMLKEAGAAYAITAITTNATDATSDDIEVGTTLGAAAAKGTAIYQSGKTGATNSAFIYPPVALVGESYDVAQLTNRLVNAVTIGQVREANIPELGAVLKAKFPLIKFI